MLKKNILLEAIIKKYKETKFKEERIDDDKIFEYFAAEQLLKNEEIDDNKIRSGLIGNGNDNGIDGFFIFLDDELIIKIDQVKSKNKYKNIKVYFHQYKNKYKIEEDVVLKFINAFTDIMNFDNKDLLGWNEELKNKIKLLRKIIEKTKESSLNIDFIINHISKANSIDIENNDSYWSKVNNLKNNIKNSKISNIDVKYNYIGGEELKELSHKNKEYRLTLRSYHEVNQINFGKDKGYIAFVTLKDYYNFISENGKLRENIFDSNVRDYQNKTKVNENIVKSILEDKNIDFWWLNNGITIIADKNSTQINKELVLQNLKIVNGLQTSYSIYNALKDVDLKEFDNNNRCLFIKIIICDQRDIMDKVILATNSQNKMPPNLLIANDSIQIDIEEYFFSKGYYYDRKRNYYQNLGKPKNEIISVNLLAQCIVSMILEEKDPSKARSNSGGLIKRDEDYKKIFESRYNPPAYLNSVLIIKKVEEELKNLEADEKLTKDIIIKDIIKFFKFHISRLLISDITKKANPTDKDIENENILIDISTNNIKESINTLKETINKYNEENIYSRENISKQTNFSKFIDKVLIRKYAKNKTN